MLDINEMCSRAQGISTVLYHGPQFIIFLYKCNAAHRYAHLIKIVTYFKFSVTNLSLGWA